MAVRPPAAAIARNGAGLFPRSDAVKRFLTVLLATGSVVLPAGAEPLTLGRFSSGDTEGWGVRAFEGETRYRIVERGGRRVLEADSDASASSFYLKREIDLAASPVLEWRWRIERTVSAAGAEADEQSKDGDDFAARVYAVAPGGGLFGWPIAISYVWAGRSEVGDAWPNPYTSRVMMLAVDSGDREAGTWRTHRRNVRADFQRLFGRRVDRLEGIAVMTDTDNTGSKVRAWYGDIALYPE